MIAALIGSRRRWMTQENILFGWHLNLTLVLVWWAVVLAWPGPTFPVSHAYDRFAAISPDESFWAAGFGFASLVGMLGVWAAWPSRAAVQHGWLPVLRITSALFLAFMHGTIAILMFDGSRAGTGPGIYVLIMCSAYLLLRAEYERS